MRWSFMSKFQLNRMDAWMILDKWTVEPSEFGRFFQLEKRVIEQTTLLTENHALAVFETTESAQEIADKLNSGEAVPVLPQNRI